MAEVEYEVVRLTGEVHLFVYPEGTDDLEAHTLSPDDARSLGNALIEKADQEEDDHV